MERFFFFGVNSSIDQMISWNCPFNNILDFISNMEQIDVIFKPALTTWILYETRPYENTYDLKLALTQIDVVWNPPLQK